MAAKRRRLAFDCGRGDSGSEDVGEVTSYDPESGIGELVTNEGTIYRLMDEAYRYPSIDEYGNIIPVAHPHARMEFRVGDRVMFRWSMNLGRKCVDWWMLKCEYDDFKQAIETGTLFRVISIDTKRSRKHPQHTIVVWRGRTLDQLVNSFSGVRTPADFRWSRGRGRYQYRLQRYDRDRNRWSDLPREALTDGTLPTYMIGVDELTAEATAEVVG